MDRFKVTEVQCSKCLTVQKAQQTCEKCSTQFGEYYCDICHLFDKNKQQYHCPPCGICRIGPRDDYFHCDTCNLCLARTLEGKHKCVENVSRQNCPVCMEDIHTSRIGAHVLPCGHLLHKNCFDDMLRNGAYRCPLCMHSAVEMQNSWREIDEEIAQTPMPTDYRNTTVPIVCCDCQAHSTASYHIFGMKCGDCGSYNTVQDGGLIQNNLLQENPDNSDAEPESDDEPQQEDDEPQQEDNPQQQGEDDEPAVL